MHGEEETLQASRKLLEVYKEDLDLHLENESCEQSKGYEQTVVHPINTP